MTFEAYTVMINLRHRIGCFFVTRSQQLLNQLHLTERRLLAALDFEAQLSLEQDPRESTGLFGYRRVVTDYRPVSDPQTIIEVKHIRPRRNSQSKNLHNEYDIKNGLSQIIEQAVCKSASRAILVILDAGRSNNRPWNQQERHFISMFKNNPFRRGGRP